MMHVAPFSIRAMTVDDLPVGLNLSRQAGWNQTEADWARLLDLQPDGGFVAEREGRPVGTVTTCVFGAVAWVAMVLVEETARGRGIGRSLVEHALGFLDRRGVRTVRLDATPLGRPLYESLGFVAEQGMARHQGRLPEAGPPPGSRPVRDDRADDLLALDRAVTGTDRSKALRRLVSERPETLRVARRDGRVDGFLLARPGAFAWQVGPCIAGPEAGALLLTEALRDYGGQSVIVDIPVDHAGARSVAEAGGLTVRRQLLRMRRGDAVDERPADLWAGSGPEKG